MLSFSFLRASKRLLLFRMEEFTDMSSMRVREESRLMLLWSFLSCLPSLLLSSPCSLRSSCSCLAAASARWKPLVGSVLATISQ